MRTDRASERVESITTVKDPWSPAQILAGIIGLFMTVLGGVALARLLPTDSLTGETTTVIGMGFTVVMAVITLILGLVFLGGAGRPANARSGLISLGVALLAFGIVTFIEPEALGGARCQPDEWRGLRHRRPDRRHRRHHLTHHDEPSCRRGEGRAG
jgi:hypothetical protein